ncbi:MAG: PAS domain S-box protein [Methanomicrobiales archaeon]|nr:PAS domain S-box protein [Methanomicrobiales archaeon]
MAQKYPMVRRLGNNIFAETFISSFHNGMGGMVWGKASILTNRDGVVIGVIESIRDITTWKRAVEGTMFVDLPQMQAQLDAVTMELAPPIKDNSPVEEKHEPAAGVQLPELFRSAGDPIVVLDRVGRLLYANDAFLEISASSDGTPLVGKSIVQFVASEYRRSILGMIRYLQQNSKREVVFGLLTPSGRVMLSGHFSAGKDLDGTLMGILGIFRVV